MHFFEKYPELEVAQDFMEDWGYQTIVADFEEPSDNPMRSNIVSTPYWEEGLEWPLDKNGDPHYYFVQINFAELPPNDKYPDKGILQFFLPCEDVLLGVEFGGKKKPDFGTVFHENPDKEKAVPPTGPIAKESRYAPAGSPKDFSFRKSLEFSAPCEKRFEENVGMNYEAFFQLIEDEERRAEAKEAFEKAQSSENAVKMGGYPFFTQRDPRPYKAPSHDHLLLQLDSCQYVQWGDYGVGNFFIKSSHLKKASFKKVFYTWDCH